MTSPIVDKCGSMLPVYDLSYLWFSPISCMWVIVVGSLISLIKPTNYRFLDRRLISPAFPKLFSWWPSPVRKWFHKYWDQIGSKRDENDLQGDDNKGYVLEK